MEERKPQDIVLNIQKFFFVSLIQLFLAPILLFCHIIFRGYGTTFHKWNSYASKACFTFHFTNTAKAVVKRQTEKLHKGLFKLDEIRRKQPKTE